MGCPREYSALWFILSKNDLPRAPAAAILIFYLEMAMLEFVSSVVAGLLAAFLFEQRRRLGYWVAGGLLVFGNCLLRVLGDDLGIKKRAFC